jgi:hypothetical protein
VGGPEEVPLGDPPAEASPEKQATAPGHPRKGPTLVEVLAWVLLLSSVALHVVAMTTTYYKGEPTLAAQSDQAALYSILAACWAIAFVSGLLGPKRIAVTAGFALGLAATELGFRVSDVGGALHLGAGTAGTGMWIMTIAWGAGAAGAVLLLVAAQDRARASQGDGSEPAGRYERTAGWVAVVGLLGLATAGLFLPPWDHYQLTSTVTGVSRSVNLGNGLSGPWPIVLGNLIVAASIVILAIAGIVTRRRRRGAALVAGSLAVLAGQMVSAVIQVDQPVSPTSVGLSQGTITQLGVVIKVSLTGWFALDAIAALVLLSAMMCWATARLAQANSSARRANAPAARSAAMPSAS